MLTTMYRGYGDNRIYIHGHLNDEEMAAYQRDGWSMRVPGKTHKLKHEKPSNIQQNKHGIPLSTKGAS